MTTKTATTPETTPEQQARYVPGASDGDRILLPDGLSCTPPAVQALSDEAVRLRAVAEAAGQQLAAARAELKQARALDQAADRAASAANRELPTQRAEAAAAEALALAERAHEAATKNARTSVLDLVRGIGKARGAWLIEQEGVEESIRSDMRVTLQQLSEQFAALTREGQVLNVLRKFPEQGSLHEVSFGRPTRFDARWRESHDAEIAKKVANTQGNMAALVPRQPEFLLAELRRQIGE